MKYQGKKFCLLLLMVGMLGITGCVSEADREAVIEKLFSEGIIPKDYTLYDCQGRSDVGVPQMRYTYYYVDEEFEEEDILITEEDTENPDTTGDMRVVELREYGDGKIQAVVYEDACVTLKLTETTDYDGEPVVRKEYTIVDYKDSETYYLGYQKVFFSERMVFMDKDGEFLD